VTGVQTCALPISSFLTGRIRGEIQAVRLSSKGEVVIDDPGLHHGALILDVELENAVHAREYDHHAAGAGERAARKTRAGAAADHGNVVFRGEFDDTGDLFCRCRENHDIRAALFDGAIIFIEKKIFRPIKNRGRAEELFKIPNQARVHRRAGEGATGTIVRILALAQRQVMRVAQRCVSVIFPKLYRGRDAEAESVRDP
jgi:hypothetical protein